MKRIFILAFLLAWLTAQFAAAAAVDTLAVRSASMDRDIPVIVILPDGASPANPCPTVYLLHGYGGNQTTWLRIKPSLPAIADREGIAFVCPDGATSWYLDSKVRAKSLYETFMTRELLPAVEERYPVSSGGLDIRPFPENWEIPQLLGTQAEHPEAWEAATPINLIPRIADGDLAIVIDCGYDDFFFGVNNDFHAELLRRGIMHDFYVRPGRHNNEYWGNSIDYQIVFFRNFFFRDK